MTTSGKRTVDDNTVWQSRGEIDEICSVERNASDHALSFWSRDRDGDDAIWPLFAQARGCWTPP